MTGMNRLADEIAGHGVPMLFGIPGSGASLMLIDALEKHGIPFHLTHFEGAGALMAATVGHLSGRAGVSVSIKGPGLANALPGITAACFESYPLVHIAEAFTPDAPLSQAHKRLDHDALARPITKAARYFGSAGGFPALAHLALAEEPGPVLMNLAPREVVVEQKLPEAEVPAGEDVGAAVELVGRSRSPVVIAGTAAIRAGLGPVLAALSCPVFSTAAAKGVLDEAAPHAAGVYTGVGLALTPEFGLLPNADLVVGIGLTAKEVLAAKAFRCAYLAIDAAESPGSDAFSPAVRIGIGAAPAVCEALAAKPAWGIDELRRIQTRLRARMAERFLPGAVFDAIARRFERRVRLVMDTGYFCTIGEHVWQSSDPSLCLLSGQGRYMGTGIPMALGAALYDGKHPTVAVLGDGGVGMYLAEVKLAVRHKLPLLIVLMTDNAFGSIRTRAIQDHLTQIPLTMDGRSWVPTFESFGLASLRAASLDAVERALASWKPAEGPAFLEVPFDPDAYEAMVKDIR